VIDKVVVHQTMSTLAVIGIGLFVFMIFTSAMTWVRQYLVLHTGNRVDAVLGSRVFDHLLDLSPRYFEHRPTGILTARLHGVETIREFVSGAAVTLLLDLPFLFIFLAVMFYYSWQLSLIAVGLLGTIAVLSFLVAPVFRERLNSQFLVGARNQAFLTEYLAGIETVKSLQMEPQLKKSYGGFLAEYLAASFRTKQIANTYSVISNGLEQVMTLAILCVGAWLVMHNDGFTVGMLVAFQMFAGRLSQPLLRLVGLWQEFQQAGISVKRLGDILNAPREPMSLVPTRANNTDATDGVANGAANKGGRVEINHIAFRYAQDRPFLYRDLSLKLAPGKVLALMGPSGSGKSTLAKLLQGFHFPEEGNITLDGRDIKQLAANELRSHFGVVPQETTLFSGTLYNNLSLANPHATFEQIVQACKWAEMHDTIEQLPQGYQTEVGERGVGLSGGQKQRIAIARALLKQPRILIFDEATANLDHATAEHFAHTINKLKGRVTMLFIAHQLPRGLQVDEVITLGEHGAKMSVVSEGAVSE
jgi:subfamily B ATP-binding cassette protein HlyB/CyaB